MNDNEQTTSSALRLIQIYNEVERIMENGDENYLPFAKRVRDKSQRDGRYYKYRDELLFLAELRNLIVHNTYLDSINPIIYPNSKLIESYEEILKHISSPDIALSTIAMPLKQIYSVTPNTRALDAISNMYRNGYSHAPVLQNGCVIGVFSEYSVLSYLASHGGTITNDLLISQINTVLALSEYKKERYSFVAPSATVYDVAYKFQSAINRGGQTRVVFITDTGFEKGKLLGMVTPMNLMNFRW